jgi:transposase
MTKPKPYKRYSDEFKKEAVRRAAEEGATDKAVCDELGISTRQFRRWRYELEVLGKYAFPGKGQSRDDEVTALKRELAKVKKERDFLKDKRVGIFDAARTSPRTRSEVRLHRTMS